MSYDPDEGLCRPSLYLSQSLTPMTEDEYTSTVWDSGDQSEAHPFAVQSHGRPSFQSLESVDERESANGHLNSMSSQPRSSSDSRSKSPTSQPWRDTATTSSDRPEALSAKHSRTPSLVEPSFDENVLRALCELDVNIYVFFDILLPDITFLIVWSSATS